MKLAFLDANILFSAAHSPLGRAAIFIAEAHRIGFECVTSGLAVGEAQRNLSKKSPQALPAFEGLLKGLRVEKMTRFSRSCGIKLRAKDEHIFLAALECKADVLVTGDHKGFGPYLNDPKKTGGLLICTLIQLQDKGR